MIAPVFVDTNVLVHALQAGEPAKQRAAVHWLEHLWREQAGRTSIQVLNEYYVTMTRKIRPALQREEAWDLVQALLPWNPMPIDAAALSRAREIEARYRLSWWDSLIVATAQLQNCSLLLSEDLQNQAIFGSVTVRNPFMLGVAEAAATYSAPSATALRRYRSRGRPKRAQLQET